MEINNNKNIGGNVPPQQDNSFSREQLALTNLVVNSVKNQLLGRGSGDQHVQLYETFGYKQDLQYRDYLRAYRRQGIASRIINSIVDFTWKDFPLIYDDDEIKIQADTVEKGSTLNSLKVSKHKAKLTSLSNKQSKCLGNLDAKAARIALNEHSSLEAKGIEYSEFELAIEDMQKKFKLLRQIKRADILSCIGRFSIIVIGTCVPVDEDGDIKINSLDRELPIGTSLDDIAFISTFSEDQVTINSWETSPSSPRYGLPKTYKISTSGEDSGVTISHNVHWSRVIHIAEDLIESDVYGLPKLEKIYNDLQDLLKVVGGSAEMFWLGAYQGLVFNVKDGYALDDKARAQMTEEIQKYESKLQRFIKTKGVEVSSLSGSVADPNGNVDVLIKLISGASNVPVRILIGAENGVYAGDTDQDTFFSYITSRRNSHGTETIIEPLLQKLIDNGYLPQPKGEDFFVIWPDLFEQSTTEKVTNAKLIVDTLKAATQFGNALELTTIEEIRGLLGLDDEIPETMYNPYELDSEGLLEEEIDSLPTEEEITPMKSYSREWWLNNESKES